MQKAHDASKNNWWENLPSIATPIVAEELNRNETSVDAIDDRVVTFDTTKANQTDLLLAVKSISFDKNTGIFTITKFNNTSTTIDTDIEKIAINFDYDDDPTSPHYQNLVITLDDGTVKYIDMSALVTQYDFSDSAQIHFTNTSGTISATIINGSITEEKLQPNFLADCRAAKTAAETAEANAQSSEDEANAWANGEIDGVPVPSTHPAYHNNAKYYKDLANPTSLVALTDTDINYPKSGEVLTFNGNMWENREFFSPEDITVTDSFESYTGGRVKSVQMELSPIQDLHGYSEPWVGGAGKNKLDKDNYVLSYTSDNLVIIGTVNIESGKSYTFSCEQDKDLTGSTRNTLAVTYDGNTYYEMVNSNYHNEKGTHTYNFASNYTGTATLAFWCHTPSDTSITYSKFMFQEGVYTAYEPYENKCPISGHTQAKLEQRGKNRLPNIIEQRSTHSFWVGQSSGSTYPFHFEKDKTYAISFNSNYSTSSMYYAESGGVDTEIGRSGSTFTPSKDMDVDLWIYGGGLSEVSNVQIELGSTATDYEPYQGKDYIINLGGTYYWLRGDVVSGKWYVVGQSVEYDGSSDENWEIYPSDTSAFFFITVSAMTSTSWSYVLSEAFKDVYKESDARNNDCSIWSRYQQIHIHAPSSIVPSGITNEGLAEFKAWLSNNPQKVVYKLATPIPINLDPQQILAIIGENNFSAPLDQQEIIEIIARNIAEFNEVIDDENISDEFTYSSEKIEDRLDEYVDKGAVEEKSATTEFETINGGLLSECKVSLSPNQDLHGYSEPWVGGAGANKWDEEWRNGYYQLDTQASNYGQFVSFAGAVANKNPISVLPSTTYAMCVVSSGSGSIFFYDGNHDVISHTLFYTSPFSFTTPANCAYVNFNMNASPYGATYKNDIALNYPSTVTTYSPYSNICPISGHTQVEVGNDGKNKLPNEATSQTVNGVTFDINNDGSITLNGQSSADWTGITLTSAKFLKAGTYTVSCPRINSVDTRLIISYDGAEKVNTYNVDYKTFTLTEDKIISVRFVIRNSGVSFSNVTYYPMIELGSTATPYVPYNGYQVTVNLGGTYYSGTLDVVSGVFTPDTAVKEYDGSVDENWIKVSGENRYYIEKPSDINANPDGSTSNEFKYSGTSGASVPDGQFYVGGTNLGVRLNTITSVADWKTFLSNNPMTVVYPLATPTSIQLSPTMVKALVGENHLSAPLEGQEITESKYRELFTWDEVSGVTDSLDSRVDTLETNASKITWSSSVSKAIDDTTCTIQDPKITTSSIIEPFYSNASGDNVVIKNQIATTGQVVLTFDALLEATSFRVRITNL